MRAFEFKRSDLVIKQARAYFQDKNVCFETGHEFMSQSGTNGKNVPDFLDDPYQVI